MNGEKNQDEKQWAMIAHLSGLACYVFPFGNIIAPLIIWLSKGKESRFVEQQARETLNFQVTLTIAAVVPCFLLILSLFISFLSFLMIAAFGVLSVINIAFSIISAMKANEGEDYKYPFALRIITEAHFTKFAGTTGGNPQETKPQ